MSDDIPGMRIDAASPEALIRALADGKAQADGSRLRWHDASGRRRWLSGSRPSGSPPLLVIGLCTAAMCWGCTNSVAREQESVPAATNEPPLATPEAAELPCLELPSLSIGGKVIIRTTEALDDAALAALQQLPVGVVLALSTPSSAAQLSPCPWVDDHACDESRKDCAAGSDVNDCHCRNFSNGVPTCFP